jgi:hypothetical protein
MATFSVRTNRGDDDFKVVSANPGTAVTAKNYEFNFTIGAGARPDEAFLALKRIEDYLTSHPELWQGIL